MILSSSVQGLQSNFLYRLSMETVLLCQLGFSLLRFGSCQVHSFHTECSYPILHPHIQEVA